MDCGHLARALLDHVRQHAALIFLVLDPDGVICEANNHACELIGDPVGKNITDILIDFDGSFQLSQVLAENAAPHLINIPTRFGVPQTFYFRFITTGASIMVIGEVNSLELEGLRVTLVDTNNQINTLVRELHKKNAELARARETADAATRAKSIFLSSMSHEIRTPLNAVIGIGRLLLETPMDPKQKMFLDDLVAAADSLLGIINDILDISRIEADRLELTAEPFDVSHVFRREVDTLGYLARNKGLSLSLSIDPAVPNFLVGDSNRLRQILSNLVGNAIKFTQSGEVDVTVSGSVLDDQPEPGNLSTWRLVFSVRDTGIGIPADKLEHIFESFAQVDTITTCSLGGTGLGLAIVWRLVDKMGGEITLSSEVGFGSCFTVAIPLPVAIVPCGTVPDSAEVQAPRGVRPLTILHADDNEINRRFMVEMMARRGHVVDSVSSGMEILEALFRRSYDLVLTDIIMPGMDGIAATRQIRSSLSDGFDPGIPVIALSAAMMPENIEALRAAGFNGYVGKPVDFDELDRVIGETVPGAMTASSNGILTPLSVEVPVEHPVFDLEYQARHFKGSQAFMEELLQIFMQELPGRLAEIEQGIADNNFSNVGEIAHVLKGTAATMGAVALVKCCALMSVAARDANLTNMKSGLERLQIEVERLRREQKTMLRFA
jgi:signal transduction histidine kinase/HPt (histidine-containing phosphotransfer) domain-containing protein/ActR/RegA family two-component response regulator